MTQPTLTLYRDGPGRLNSGYAAYWDDDHHRVRMIHSPHADPHSTDPEIAWWVDYSELLDQQPSQQWLHSPAN